MMLRQVSLEGVLLNNVINNTITWKEKKFFGGVVCFLLEELHLCYVRTMSQKQDNALQLDSGLFSVTVQKKKRVISVLASVSEKYYGTFIPSFLAYPGFSHPLFFNL